MPTKTTTLPTPGEQYLHVAVQFPRWDQAHDAARAHLLPALSNDAIAGWFIVRKYPCWRIRYRPSHSPDAARDHVHSAMSALAAEGHLTTWVPGIYEPEVCAFGGPAAMTCAHALFERDTQHLLAATTAPAFGHREASVLLLTLLLRAAGLDWYEQGDVWARAAEHRPRPATERVTALAPSIRKLISAATQPLTLADPTLAVWARPFTDAGESLAALATQGQLTRGLRAVLAHHVIFAWNRHGIPAADQGALAHAAASAVFEDHPARPQPASQQAAL